MLIRSERLGEIDVPEDELVTFPKGVVGFPEERRFALIEAEETGTYFWLQSATTPSLAFLCVPPWPFFPDYSFECDPEDEELIGLETASDVVVLCIVTVKDTVATVNLLGPLLMCNRTRRAVQAVLRGTAYSTSEPLAGA